MNDYRCKSPVALLVFNRPDETRVVFEQIRKSAPRRLLVVSDGPRPGVPADVENCRRVRELIQEGVDWDCELLTNYSAAHMGCKLRVSSGLDWVFELNDRAIVLEDDCVPAMSFFRYCDELLESFSNDSRIMQICGTNVSQDTTSKEYSFYFSKFGPIWGWASWRRAWKFYDVSMREWPKIVADKIYENFWEFPGEAAFRLEIYEEVYRGHVDTWDLQWGFTKFINSGLSIVPSKNLIRNIGYGDNATHTKTTGSPAANLITEDLEFPLRHFPFVVRKRSVDLDFHNIMTPARFRGNGPG
jgi:hypothetical protein